MITSMNRSELYKTLVGHYKTDCYSTSSNSKTVENTVTNKIAGIPVEDIRNAMKENKKNGPVIDISNDRNTDRFELSDRIVNQDYDIAAAFRNIELKEMPYAASDGIDFMEPHIQGLLGEGYTNGLPTTERIVEFYGDMAKRLDKAYAEGKFTKDEYDELNEMIEKQVEKEAALTENKTAFYALGKKRYSLSPEAVAEIVQREKSMTPEERLAAREQEIRDYAERYCNIDRVALMKLFNSIRYNK